MKDGGCPCQHTTPCHPRCTCVMPYSSRGCERCCSYGSLTQRKENAERIAMKMNLSAKTMAGTSILLKAEDAQHEKGA